MTPRPRKLLISFLAASALAVGGATYGVTQYRNIPGPITGSYADGITGTFHVEVDPAGIPSPPSGGACIIARASDLGYTKMQKIHCSTSDQCTSSENPNGYCELPAHQCWAKPAGSDPELCKKFPGTIAAGVNIAIPVSHASLTALKISTHAKVRVLTCLNGIPTGGCADPTKPSRHEWGVPKQLHP